MMRTPPRDATLVRHRAPRLFALLAAFAFACAVHAQNDARIEVPFEWADGHLFVEARVNGSEPLAFMIDSTSGSSLDPQAALRASTLAQGASGDFEPVSIEIGAARMSGVRLAPLSTRSFEPTLGHRWDGVLGREWFARYVIDIDYDKRIVAFVEPRAFAAPASMERLPLAVDAGVPYVEAALALPGANVHGAFMVDAGASTAVTLYAEPRDRALARAAQAATRDAFAGARVPGAQGASSATGFADSLRLGGTTLQAPLVEFSSERGATVGASPVVGILGNGVLSRFHVIVDVSRRELFVTPTARVGVPFGPDASGVALIARGERFFTIEVSAVSPRSPGAQAGIEPGDVIAAIDDRTGLSLGDVRETLRDAGGSHTLTLDRRGRTFNVPIMLRTP